MNVNYQPSLSSINTNFIKCLIISLFGFCVAFIFGLNIPTYSSTALIVVLFLFTILKWPFNVLSINYILKLILLSYFVLIFYTISFAYDYIAARSFLTNTCLIIGAYIVGRSMDIKSLQGGIYNLTAVILAMIAGLVAFSYLTVRATLFASPQDILYAREVQSFWDASPLSATNIGIFYSLGLSIFPALIYVGTIKTKHFYQILFAASIILLVTLSMYVGLLMQNRSPYVSLVTAFVLSVIIGRKYLFDIVKKHVIVTFIFLSLLMIFSLLLYDEGEFIWNMIRSRFDYKGLESERYTAWYYMLVNMFDNPMGGKVTYIGDLNYVHNLWLDVAFKAGLIPMIFLILFHALHVKDFLSILKSRLSLFVKAVVVCVATSFLISFAVEPVLEASTLLFAASCFFLGTVSLISDNMKYF